jgi:hypothetical protein
MSEQMRLQQRTQLKYLMDPFGRDRLYNRPIVCARRNPTFRLLETRIIEEVVQSRADADSWIEAADKLLATTTLADRERDFVSDMKLRFDIKPSFTPSEKQTSWFVKLYKTHV